MSGYRQVRAVNNLLELHTDILRMLVKKYFRLCERFALSFCCKRWKELISESPVPGMLTWSRRRGLTPIVAGIATSQGWVEYLEWLYALTKGKCFFSCIKMASKQQDSDARYKVLKWYQSKSEPTPPEKFIPDVLEMAAIAKDAQLVERIWKEYAITPCGQKHYYFFEQCKRSGVLDLILFQARAQAWNTPGSAFSYKNVFNDDMGSVQLDKDILDDMAASGNVETAKKLVAVGFKFNEKGVIGAIQSKCTEMLELAIQHKGRYFGRPGTAQRSIFRSWAKLGTVEQLVLLGEPDPANGFYKELAFGAASAANIKTFDWLCAKLPKNESIDLVTIASHCLIPRARGKMCVSDSKVIKFLENLIKKHSLVPTQELANIASGYGRFKILAWIVDNQYPHDKEKCMTGLEEYYCRIVGVPVSIKRSRVDEELSKRGIKMRKLDVDEMDK